MNDNLGRIPWPRGFDACALRVWWDLFYGIEADEPTTDRVRSGPELVMDGWDSGADVGAGECVELDPPG